MTDHPQTLRLFSLPTKRVSISIGVLILGTSCVLAFIASGSMRGFGSAEQKVRFETAEVVDAPFEYTVKAAGVVNSQKFANLESEVDGFTTVLWLIPAGTEVDEPLRSEVSGVVTSVQHPTPKRSVVVVTTPDEKKHRHEFERTQEVSEVVVTPGDRVRRNQILAGDVVCRLDASDLELREKNYEIRVHDYKSLFEKAKQDVEIRRALNESNNSQARLDARLAELDLKSYLEGTHPQQIEKMKGQIQQSREDLKRAQEVYEFTRRVAEKGYKNEDEVEQARLDVLKLENTLKDQEKSLEVMENFDHQRQLMELTETSVDLKRQQTRIRLTGEAAMAQFRKILAARERVYNIYKERLDDTRRQIAACTIVAPQSGQVVYATEGRRTPEPTAVGQKVRERQDLIHLPDLSKMKVDARIHESLISRIHEGLPASIRVDSLPREVFQSRISELSEVPVPGQYPNYNRKEYIAELNIEIPEELAGQLRPGMSANVEILVEQINEPVTQVPMQSVVRVGKHHFLWVATRQGTQRREIEVGSSNDVTFIVKDGVSPGEKVVMKPLERFAEEITELRKQFDFEQQPACEFEELVEAEEDQIPQSEEEFLEMIGFYDGTKDASSSAVERKSQPDSSVGD